MLSGLFKSKEERFKEEFANKLQYSAIKILAGLNTQVDYLEFFEGKQRRNLLTDTYFLRYTFGMIDAINTLLGLELRIKIRMQNIAIWYVRYLIQEFELDQTTALKVFAKTYVKFYNTEEGQRDDAILDGGADGVSVLRVQRIPHKDCRKSLTWAGTTTLR